MFHPEFFGFSLWWIFPIAMMVLCFLMMTGRRGRTMCGFGPHDEDISLTNASDSTLEILDKRYARGEIGRDEYETIKSDITKNYSDSVK